MGECRTVGQLALGRFAGTITDVDTGFRVSCAIYDTGALRCWGSNNHAIGYDINENIGDDEFPSDFDYVQVF